MKVDQESLGALLKNVEDREQSNFPYAVGWQVKTDNVLPMFNIEGLGTIPVPVNIKDLNRLKKLSEPSHYSATPSSSLSAKSKATCREINANYLYRHGETAENFLWKTVPSLCEEGLILLGFDEADISLVEAKPCAILLCERGASYPLQRDVEDEPGMFATLHVQIPVKNGFDGGALTVKHRDQSITFDHNNFSNRAFYSTVFYAGCEHALAEVEHGWRLVFIFNLIWKWTRPTFMPTPRGDPFVSTAKEIERLLSPWRLPDHLQQRLLAIPLHYSYTRESLSFSGLKGLDRWIAALLHSVDFIDLHLALIRRQLKSNLNDVELTMDHDVSTTSWVSSRTDSKFVFHGLDIDFESEVVLPVYPTHFIFTEPKSIETTPNEKPIEYDNFCYREAMLVIWPKTSTIDFACNNGFIGALDLLELLTTTMPKEQVLYVLGRTVSFCCSQPRFVWKSIHPVDVGPGVVTCRLLQLCVDLNAAEQGLILLDLLADDLPPNPLRDPTDCVVEYEGIQTPQVAVTLGKLVHLAGWQSCREAILRLLTPPKITAQMEPMAVLVISLMNNGYIQGAVEVANHLCAVLFTSTVQLQWPTSTLKTISEMIFRLEEWAESSHSPRVSAYLSIVQRLETFQICEIIVELQKALPYLIKRISDTETLYRDICRILIERDLVKIRTVHNDSILTDVIKSLLWFSDTYILDGFLRRVTMPTTENNSSLQALVSSESVWDACLSSGYGRHYLEILVDCRLRELSLLKPPVFSWEQPDASMPNFPEIESFLRSSEQSTVFSQKFPDVNEARLWAGDTFGQNYEVLSAPDSQFFLERRYSVTVQIKKVATGNVVCVITKNRRYYEYCVRQFELRQDELIDLIKRRRSDLSNEPTRAQKRVKFDFSLKV